MVSTCIHWFLGDLPQGPLLGQLLKYFSTTPNCKCKLHYIFLPLLGEPLVKFEVFDNLTDTDLYVVLEDSLPLQISAV